MWTSLKICSHCVAVVHSLDCVSKYVNWFTTNAKTNLTKITTSCIGANVGKKPSQNRYSQRKSKLPISTRIPHSSFTSSEQVTASESPSYGYTSLFQSPRSSTFDAPFGNIYQQPGFFPNWCNYPYSPFNAEMPHPMLTQNFCGGYNSPSVTLGYNLPSITLNCNTSSSSQIH